MFGEPDATFLFNPTHRKSLSQNRNVLVLSALRDEHHPNHMDIEEAIDAARELNVKRTIFTHCSCRVDYESVIANLPDGFEVAYDGLRIPLT